MKPSKELELLLTIDENVENREDFGIKNLISEICSNPKFKSLAQTRILKSCLGVEEEKLEKKFFSFFSQFTVQEINRFKEDAEKLEGGFVCTICMEIMKEPHEVKESGQVYCGECITEWFKKKNSDPNTNQILKDKKHSRNQFVHGTILHHKDCFFFNACILLKIFVKNAKIFIEVHDEARSHNFFETIIQICEKCLDYKMDNVEIHEIFEEVIRLVCECNSEIYRKMIESFCEISLKFIKILKKKRNFSLCKKKLVELKRRRDYSPEILMNILDELIKLPQFELNTSQPYCDFGKERCLWAVELFETYKKSGKELKGIEMLRNLAETYPRCIFLKERCAKFEKLPIKLTEIYYQIGCLWMIENKKNALRSFRTSNGVTPTKKCFLKMIEILKDPLELSSLYYQLSGFCNSSKEKIEILNKSIENDNKKVIAGKELINIYSEKMNLSKVLEVVNLMHSSLRSSMKLYGMSKIIKTQKKHIEHLNLSVRLFYSSFTPQEGFSVSENGKRIIKTEISKKTAFFSQKIEKYFVVFVEKRGMGNLGNLIIGVSKMDYSTKDSRVVNQKVGWNDYSVGVYNDGYILHNKENSSASIENGYSVGDLITVEVDYTEKIVTFTVHQKKIGIKRIVDKRLKFNNELYPAVYMYFSGSSCRIVEMDGRKFP